MIDETLAAINERIAAQIDADPDNLGVYGIAVPVQDQQERAISLMLLDGSKRFGTDSRLLWQSAHLLDGAQRVSQQTWGSFSDNIYNVRFILIGLSKSALGMELAMRALDGVSYVVVDGYENDTLNVLKRYFRVRADQGKNYDPATFAWAIRYHIEGVTDDDYSQLPTEEQIAQLPILAPVDEPDTPPVVPFSNVTDVPAYLAESEQNQKLTLDTIATYAQAQELAEDGVAAAYIITNDEQFGSSLTIWNGSEFSVLPLIPRARTDNG